jgi:prepilin-type N-terminal cleavage/methylation domain-containing protein
MEKELEKNLDQELGAELETVEAPKKPSFLRRLRNHRGFSLVEMAIVLVIIGIIIGAIVKGQDLILNANAKKVISAVSTWRNLSLAYLDRNGRYPGDSGKDGIIGNGTTPTEDTANSANTEISTTMSNAPANPITVGSYTFYAYFGNVRGLPLAGQNRNVISLCKDAACTAAFSKEDLELLKTVDTALDGEADAGKGQFRSSNAAVTTPATTLTFLSPTFSNYSTTNVANTWANVDIVAAVWAFDRPL